MLPQIRAFLIVTEEGSINRAAERLRLSQSALSRQMQALEHEMGGALLERTSNGVTLTPAGLALQTAMGTVLAGYDRAVTDVRRIVRGEKNLIRIGYMASAAKEYLDAALKRVKDMPVSLVAAPTHSASSSLAGRSVLSQNSAVPSVSSVCSRLSDQKRT